MTEKAAGPKTYFLIFILFFITFAYFFQGGGWNQNTRICLTRAIIDQQTFVIDAYKEDLKDPSFEFVNTGDWAFKDGHYYTNKSPGMSLLAVPSFALTEFISERILGFDKETQVLLSAYVSTLSTTVVYASLLALLIFYMCNIFFRMSVGNSFLLTLFYATGTLVFSYSTTFYCHVPSAFFSFAAFVVALITKRETPARFRSMGFGCGFAAALAVLIEPSAVFLLGIICVYLISFESGRKAIPWFLLGCVPAGILQCGYNLACFGSVLGSSYLYSNPQVMWIEDGKLFGWPRLKTLAELLFFPYRGIFITSPVLLMVLPGTVLLFKNRKWFPEALVWLAAALTFLLFIAGFHAWHGGSAVGPRYLLPAYPFAYILAVFSFNRFKKTFCVLGGLGVIINLAITIVGNEIPITVRSPLTDVIFKKLFSGQVSINPVPFMNFEKYPHISTMVNVENWETNLNSFNLGELLFANHIASIIPLFLFWLVWGIVWKKNSLKR